MNSANRLLLSDLALHIAAQSLTTGNLGLGFSSVPKWSAQDSSSVRQIKNSTRQLLSLFDNLQLILFNSSCTIQNKKFFVQQNCNFDPWHHPLAHQTHHYTDSEIVGFVNAV